MLRIAPLHPLFAAEVTGLDLAAGPDDADFERIREAFDRFSARWCRRPRGRC